MSVYLSVYPWEYLRNYTRAIFSIFLVHVAYGRDSVFLWRKEQSLLSTIALFQYCFSPVKYKIGMKKLRHCHPMYKLPEKVRETTESGDVRVE